ncbi:MAG: hypothetical protein ACJAS9_002621, partial [Polaribacter sp.]
GKKVSSQTDFDFDFNFNFNFEQLKISLMSEQAIPLTSFESITNNFSIQGKAFGESINAIINSNGVKVDIEKTNFDDESNLNLNFQFDKKGGLYQSNGTIKSSNLLINTSMNVGSCKTEKISASLKPTLNWNNISSTLDYKNENSQPTIHSSNLELLIEGTDLITSKLDLSDFTFNSKASVIDNKLTANGSIDISERRFASIQLTNKDIFSIDNTYSLEVTNSKTQSELVNQLATSFLSKIDSKNEYSLSINKGTIEHTNKLKIDDELNLKSNLVLNHFDIDINSIFLIGLNYNQNISSIDPLNLSAELNVREVTFASGLLLSNISMVANVKENQSTTNLHKPNNENNERPNISINNLKANIWNGEIQSKSIIIENGTLKPYSIDLKNIDLTELIFFLDMKGLYADGDMDIHLPIEQQNKNHTVKNGSFASNKPGIIKYDSGQTQIAVEANIALHALQNFHYEKLNGTINYNKKGDYKVKLHLLGSNPSLYDGYPIDFSLNLNGELSDVFQSVFLTGDFEKSIMERAKMNQITQ